MSKIDVVRAAMVEAMKAKDKARKDSLSMLLSALKNAEIDKREPLTEAEENSIVKKEIKQTQETYDLAPADMSVEQITEIIRSVLDELGLAQPTAKDKGAIMKVLMPKVKGKADGKVVNETLASMLK